MNEKSYVLIDSIDKLKCLIDDIRSHDIISFDTETNSLNPRKGKIIGFSISTEVGKGYYMPTMIFDGLELIDYIIEGINGHDLAKKTIQLLVDKKIIGHNLSFDCRFVNCFYGIDLIPSIYLDTVLLVHTVQEEGAGFGSGKPFGLKEIAKSIQQHIGLDIDKEANEEQLELKNSIKANLGSTSKDNYEIYKADINILAKYAAADTDLTLRLYNYYIKILKNEGLEKFFFEDEVMPLYKEVTIKMEERGVRLDIPLITKAYSSITEDLKKYHDLVVKELLNNEDVRSWIIQKATKQYPANHRGSFAQYLAKQNQLDLPYAEKTGKYSLTSKNIEKLPDSQIKEFLLSGNDILLDDDIAIKVSMALWKEDNNGNYFNIQSKDHMGGIAFSALGIKPLSETDKGKPQFDDDFIQTISSKYGWAKNLRIYNKLLKIKSTYIERFLNNQEEGKYYFYYKQHATVSGRYGSDAQQLPRPKEDGEEDPIVIEYNNMIRAFFIPYEGNVFIDDDYASLEPSVFSHVSGDNGLMDIFRNNHDFYSTIAIKTEKLYDYSPDKKADNFLRKHHPKIRNKAKAYSLGIPYGMSAYALGKTLDIPAKDAQVLVDGYLDGFPNLKKWMEESRSYVKLNGYIKTQVGRIRHLPKVKNIYSKLGDGILDWKFKTELEKKYGKEKVQEVQRDYKNGLNGSMNVQIQGLAASIVNRAAIAINRKFKEANIAGQIVAQIHDQLIAEVEESKAEEAAKIVQYCMENVTKLNVPLYAIPQITKNWRDGHA
jgi:hypothetical protein